MKQKYTDEAFLAMLHPRTDGSDLIRLGRNHDGGYVVTAKMLHESSVLFSYGVGRDVSFEEDYTKATGKRAFLFDHTVTSLPLAYAELSRLVFVQEGLSAVKEECKAPFGEHLMRFGFTASRVLLKMDIEGGEYDVMLSLLSGNIELMAGFVIEFHALARLDNRRRLFQIIKLMKSHFFVVHVHGNNCGRLFQLCDIDFPMTIEVTFARGFATALSSRHYPIVGLDYPNAKCHPDYPLPFGKLSS
ncbi:MAG: hypothetical protein OJI67_19715 [Prosthecobacter sp.]|nr:hypothetical protein [Prosthecobacter sp.]